MNRLIDFLKKKVKEYRTGKLSIPDTPAQNITGILKNPGNILIVPFNSMGTILLATRVFKAVREYYPRARITVAVHSSWSVLIQNDPTIDEVLTYGDEINDPYSPDFQTIGASISRPSFDIAFFLSYQYDLGTAYLTCLSNAALRVAFLTGEENDFFNVQIVPAAGTRYEVERYFEMLESLGIVGDIRDYTMTMSAAIREKARLKFLSGGADSKHDTFVGFDLTKEIAGDPISRKNAESTIRALVTDPDITVIVFFEPGKRDIAASLKETFGKLVMLVEDRPVSSVAGLLSFCSFVVAHNSDLFQLAVALKIPLIGILNKNEMVQWSPAPSERIVHLERSSLSWPSAALITQEAKALLRQRKQTESRSAQSGQASGEKTV